MQIDFYDSYVNKNQFFSLEVSLDQDIQRISPSPRRKEVHLDLSLIFNSVEQISKSQPRRRETFLQLTKS